MWRDAPQSNHLALAEVGLCPSQGCWVSGVDLRVLSEGAEDSLSTLSLSGEDAGADMRRSRPVTWPCTAGNNEHVLLDPEAARRRAAAALRIC